MRGRVRRHARRSCARDQQVDLAAVPTNLERALVRGQVRTRGRCRAYGALLQRLGHAACHGGRPYACEGAGAIAGGSAVGPSWLRGRTQTDSRQACGRRRRKRSLVRPVSRAHGAVADEFRDELYHALGAHGYGSAAQALTQVHGRVRGLALAAGWSNRVTFEVATLLIGVRSVLARMSVCLWLFTRGQLCLSAANT